MDSGAEAIVVLENFATTVQQVMDLIQRLKQRLPIAVAVLSNTPNSVYCSCPEGW